LVPPSLPPALRSAAALSPRHLVLVLVLLPVHEVVHVVVALIPASVVIVIVIFEAGVSARPLLSVLMPLSILGVQKRF
jgi:hypothetical protein